MGAILSPGQSQRHSGRNAATVKGFKKCGVFAQHGCLDIVRIDKCWFFKWTLASHLKLLHSTDQLGGTFRVHVPMNGGPASL